MSMALVRKVGIGGHASQDVCQMAKLMAHLEHHAKHGWMRAMDRLAPRRMGTNKPKTQGCSCGSKLGRRKRVDARGIFLCWACDKCWPKKKKTYRPDVLTDPNYWHDEPIDEEC